MTNTFPPVTWIDVESNGINPDESFLLEVAVLVTDTDLNILDEEGFTQVVYYPEQVAQMLYDQTSEYVQNMHAATGLWDRLPSGVVLSELDRQVLEYIQRFVPDARQSWLGGNSITLDRGFLNAYLPQTFNHLHYRSVDVTSWAGPAQWWTGEVYEKKKTHNAFDDIKESIEELKFLRKTLLK